MFRFSSYLKKGRMSMKKKKVLITGSTDGIGKKTALKLAEKNYRIMLHGRNLKKTKKVRKEIIEKTKNTDIDYIVADFESLKQVEKMIFHLNDKYKTIDILINNAGVFKKKREITEDGFEKTFQINYLAHFYLTNMLYDLLENSDNPKVINVASVSHNSSLDFDNLQGEKKYSGHDSYARSKLCNIMFTFRMDAKLKEKNSNIIINCLDPGNINTKLLKKGWGPIGTKPEEGANRVLFVMGIENKSGSYYVNNRMTSPSKIAMDKAMQKKLWEKSEEMLNGQEIDFESKL
ncbi:MAG: SDR family oxidoreductase [Candidatus Mcinerneyibacterium aminivorans]|uniref:SDR family oxidoreductase n=1 Tax=Candidatus Mcinerneyibacterium aminivorans TaxID=2703815 RepID=A0A5D0MI38_9BACT|nr:MAG: SDR family oxidoreductase [Candidatus Mcinerneyibacterium aminivorans]